MFSLMSKPVNIYFKSIIIILFHFVFVKVRKKDVFKSILSPQLNFISIAHLKTTDPRASQLGNRKIVK